MTAPFVTGLRTSGDDAIVIGAAGEGPILHLRVHQAELWETVRVDATGTVPVAAVKLAALAEFYPDGFVAEAFVVKVRGFEILREGDSLVASGVRDGSTLLLTSRRRRPVR